MDGYSDQNFSFDTRGHDEDRDFASPRRLAKRDPAPEATQPTRHLAPRHPDNGHAVLPKDAMSQPIKVVKAALVNVEVAAWDRGDRSLLLSLELSQSGKVFDFGLSPGDAWEAILGLALCLDRAGDSRARLALAEHGYLTAQ